MADFSFVFDRAASRAVDRAAIEEYGIPGIVLMENASRAIASSAVEMLRDRDEKSILIVCGSGNNGGDGYAAARHLHNARCDVTVCALGEPRAETDAAVNRAICRRMQLREIAADQLNAAHGGPALLIDALLGTGLDRPVEGAVATAIRWINSARSAGAHVLAADIPSGLDCDTGRALGAAVRAHRTVSFLGWKKGFREPRAAPFTGEVIVGDIGVPVEVLERFGSDR